MRRHCSRSLPNAAVDLRPTLCRAVALAAVLVTPARAELQDEIQVYLDDIDAPHEAGLELHVNTTPSASAAPEYPGEAVSSHGTRITPEFSYGLGRDWEAGLYLPAVIDAGGHADLAGAKARVKWLPRHPESSDGWFAGANLELARVAPRYSQSRWGSELRVMLGRRTDRWLVGFNPVFEWSLSDAPASATPEFSVGFKAARRVAEGVAFGAEYYAGLGPLNRFDPAAAQDHRLFATIDVDRRPGIFNAGGGYGLTHGADRWTVKVIVEVPWGGNAAVR